MTHQQALEILTTQPLIFGNENQIAAVRVIERAATCLDAVRDCEAKLHSHQRDCRECSGSGRCWHCKQECQDCDGTGKKPITPPCTCLDAFTATEIRSAREELEWERKWEL